MRRLPFLMVPALCLAAPALHAQEWRLSTQVGRLSWEGAAVGTTMEQTSIAVGVSSHGYNESLALAVGAPLSGGTHWATFGLAKRFSMDARAGFGADLNTHVFLQRTEFQVTAEAPPSLLPGRRPLDRAWKETQVIGGGGTQVMGLAFARLGDVRAEARSGLATSTVHVSGTTQQDYIPTGDGRLLLQLGAVQVGAEAEHWHHRGTYAGASAVLGLGPGVAWGRAGRWTHGLPEGVSWSAGAVVSLPRGMRLDAGFRDNGFDPLYGQAIGRSVSVGASIRLGGRSSYAPPVPAHYSAGTAVIQLRAKDAPGTPRIAGDFTEWKPVPMVPQGDTWRIALPLQPGVYHYAFVTEDGEWFVPEHTPGRRSDGMGGYVAVLVVAG